jgi:hypothetical protein
MALAAPSSAAQPDADAAFSQFPAPPAFYKLYAGGPDSGPPPPAPVSSVVHALGEPFDPVRRCRSHTYSSYMHHRCSSSSSNSSSSSSMAIGCRHPRSSRGRYLDGHTP